jgi:hypothetical protein
MKDCFKLLMKNHLFLILIFFPVLIFSQEKLEGNYNKEYKIFTTKNVDSIYFVQQFKNGNGVFFNKTFLNASTIFDNDVEMYSDEKCGLIDSTGQIILPKKYDKITIINDSILRLSNVNKQWLYNLKKKKIVSKNYDLIAHYQDRKFSQVSIGNLYGLIDLNGKEILQVQYNIVFPYYSGIITVKKNEKYGCFSTQGNLLLPIEYKNILGGEKYIIAKKDFGFEIFDKKGTFIRHLDYTRVKELENDFFAVEKYYRTYLYNIKSNILQKYTF